MALPASAMREISVAFYQSATLDPGTEEIVQKISWMVLRPWAIAQGSNALGRA